ncbi:unnamed protein product [Allacma fusca]|uniref:Uncharacterized protein n=1 Tax=Allacma fusca TaxID=39272 RepID=A0A8J2NM88_9HEXA|nr:unnamed protein product [Allacma fusca]
MVLNTNYSDDEFEDDNTEEEGMTSDTSDTNRERNTPGSLYDAGNAEKLLTDTESMAATVNSYDKDHGEITEEEADSGGKKKKRYDKMPCSNACEIVPPGYGKDVPAKKRLPLATRSNIDKIRESIPYPCEAVPKTHLPTWPDLPLYSKIPSVPAPPGAIMFSRGCLAKPLIRSNKTFILSDPWHKQRIPTNEYNALHDEHADNYLQKPKIRKLLLQQGLIDNNADVICSQKEFNRFRQYLATLHTDQLSAMIAEGDQRWLNERHQLLQLYKYQSMSEGRDHERWLKVQNAARKNQLKYMTMMQKLEQKKANDALRECKFKQEKQRQCLQRRLVGVERDRMVAEKRRRKLASDLKRRKQLICNISMRDAAAEDRIQAEKCILKRAYNQFLLEWLDAKYQYQVGEKSKRKELERAVENSLKSKAAKRQERVERYRELLPELIEERKAKEERVWVIVKRLFNKWLRKVRERKARKPDALHQSLWEGSVVMEDTLKYLRKESGYEKFDDFILNILRLKEEIKIKLAEEEAEEERERQRLSQLGEEEEEDGEEEGEDHPSKKKKSRSSKANSEGAPAPETSETQGSAAPEESLPQESAPAESVEPQAGSGTVATEGEEADE